MSHEVALFITCLTDQFYPQVGVAVTKILEKLAGFCDFSASMELARTLEPASSYELAVAHLAETSEARKLISIQDISIGGAHDVREKVELARRGGVLEAVDLLDIKYTLISCRQLRRSRLGKVMG